MVLIKMDLRLGKETGDMHVRYMCSWDSNISYVCLLFDIFDVSNLSVIINLVVSPYNGLLISDVFDSEWILILYDSL